MKSAAIELHPSTAAGGLMPLSAKARAGAYVELSKPRITSLIVLTSAAGFVLGSVGGVNYVQLAHAMIGIALLSSGIGTLNQFMERDLDGLMRRTADRPLPSRRLVPFEALWFGLTLTVLALNRGLFVCLHASEDAHNSVDRAGRFPWGDAAPDGLDGSSRRDRRGRVGAVCDSVSVAGSAFPGHRLAVSRGLRSRRHSHVAGGRT